MEPAHRNKILKRFDILVDRMEIHSLIRNLLDRGVFNQQMIEVVSSHSGRRARVHETLLLLLQRGPTAFEALLEALIETGQAYLAGLIIDDQ